MSTTPTPPEQHVTPATMTEAQAAKYIGMSASYLRQGRFTGNRHSPPFIKIGAAVRYLRQDLDAWLISKRIVANGGRHA